MHEGKPVQPAEVISMQSALIPGIKPILLGHFPVYKNLKVMWTQYSRLVRLGKEFGEVRQNDFLQSDNLFTPSPLSGPALPEQPVQACRVVT